MSAQPDLEPIHAPELRIVTSEDVRDLESQIREYALMKPEQIYEIAADYPELTLRAAKLALSYTLGWQEKVSWINVMYRATGPNQDH